MKFGTDKENTKKKNEVFTVGKDGTGEAQHPIIKPVDKDPIKERIFDIIKNKKEEVIIEKPTREKLYLNTIIKLIHYIGQFNPIRLSLNSIKNRVTPKIAKWWRKDTTVAVWDLIKFIGIHGLIVSPILISLLTLTNVEVQLIQFIKQNIWITMVVYIIGSGGCYYTFCDINKVLKENWGSRKNRK